MIASAPGVKPYTARQIYAWVYSKRVETVGEMTSLSLDLRRWLAEHVQVGWPGIGRLSTSTDGTRKYLFRFDDGRLVESVWIPEPNRNTICLSTQIGCRMGCTFCATARMGLVRNLRAGEILGEALRVLADIGYRDRRVNIVFMGMGEGLDNYDEVMKAFRLLADPDGIAISPRRITLSTVGLVPGIERLAGEERAPRLAISLNSPFDAERASIMPVGKKYTVKRLMEAASAFIHARHGDGRVRLNERVTFEYVLLQGINDTSAHAQELIRLLRNVPAKLNLLAYNESPLLPHRRPDDRSIERFKQMLLAASVPVSFRRSRGRDIEAACGQLATRHMDDPRPLD